MKTGERSVHFFFHLPVLKMIKGIQVVQKATPMLTISTI